MRLRFDHESVLFILDHYQELSQGIDPDPACVDSGRRSGSRYHAPGIVLMEWAGEIAARVQLCGLDGMLVSYRYGLDRPVTFTEQAIAEGWHLRVEDVYKKINKVTWYCTSRRRGVKKQPDGRYIREPYEVWKQRTKEYHHYRLGYVSGISSLKRTTFTPKT